MINVDSVLMQRLLLLLVITISLLLGTVVYSSNRKSKTNVFFLLTSVAICFWAFFGTAIYYEPLKEYSLLFGRVNLSAVSLWVVCLYLFIANFPLEKRMTVTDWVVALVGILFSTISIFTNWIVDNLHNNNNEVVWEMGALSEIYYLYAIAVACSIVYRLIAKYKSSKREEKISIKYFAYGISLVAVFNVIFNVIVPITFSNDGLYWFGDYSVIFILGFTAYAIMKHQLFNIKVIATEATVIILSLALLIEIFISRSISEGLIKAFIWVIATYGGYQLVKSVKVEIEQKAALEKLTEKLEESNKQLEIANKELEDLDKMKDEFISVASHELNTPLAAIEGYLSMILDEKMAKVDTKAKEYLHRAYQSSKRLAALITDLLNVSRIEQGRIHLQYQQIDILKEMEEAVNELKIKADEKKIDLGFEKPKEKIPSTWCDTGRIHEVLVNLIGNAIKFTDKGGVVVLAKKTADGIQVSVKDSGVGIAKENAEKLFHKFSQINRAQEERQGTGLGLYISRNYIEMHNGKIWAESEGEGKGTTISFTLPILKEKPFDPHENEGAVLRSKPSDEVLNKVMEISKQHAIKE